MPLGAALMGSDRVVKPKKRNKGRKLKATVGMQVVIPDRTPIPR